jgi:hypothetical protein
MPLLLNCATSPASPGRADSVKVECWVPDKDPARGKGIKYWQTFFCSVVFYISDMLQNFL